jgi:hypothetical protein
MTTLADLKNSVTGWVNRRNDADFAAVLPSFIALTEERIATSVRARPMVTRATYPVQGQYLPLPCDWLEFLDVRLQGSPCPLPLLSRLDDAGAAYYAAGIAAYRIVDGQMEVLPTQDPAAPAPPVLEIAYYAQPQTLVIDTDTNPLLSRHPSIYQFIAAMFAAVYLEDAEATQRFNDLAASAVAQANEWQQTSRFSGGRLNAQARQF